MYVNKFFFLIVFAFLIELHQCSRFRGGSGSRPRTTSRPRSTRTTARYRQSSTSGYHSSSRTTPRRYTSTTARWSPPPRPGQTYSTGNQPQNIKIVNKYNYNYPGYYSIPVQNPSHPGYFYTPSTYHYSSGDTGSTALGFFLGYSLAKITTPTYSHQSFYDGYRPRYDHYEVHHYYHNKDSVPQQQDIKPNSIVGCVGDSKTICPANTISLCTTNGALMCVVAVSSTAPCADNQQLNCVKSTISCLNNTATECKNSQNATISIPCISNAQVHGDVKVVNDTLVVTNSTTGVDTTTTSTTEQPSTKYPITTTPLSTSVRRKRDVTESFCVTVMAVPAVKKETEGEQFLKDAQSVFETFIDNIL